MTNTVFGRLQYYGTAAEKAAFTPLFTWTQWLETDTNTIYAWNGAAWITMAASGGSVGGSGTPGRIAEWTAATTLGDSTLAKTGAGLLTLTAAAPASLAVTGASSIAGSMTGGGVIATGGFTGTLPADGTFALLGTANDFTNDNTLSSGKAWILEDSTATASRTIKLYNSSVLNSFTLLSLYPYAAGNLGASILVIPKGTGYAATLKSQISVLNTDYVADTTNYELATLRAAGARFVLSSGKAGTGTLRPLTLSAGFVGDPSINDNQFVLAINGNVGVNNASPAARVHALSTTEQLRLGYDVSNYASFTVAAAGGLTIATVGDMTLTPAATLTLTDGKNLAFGTTTGSKIGTATTQKLGFWNATPVVQQVLSAYTPDDESAAYTGIDNAQAGSVYAQVSDLNALRVAYETLRAAYDDMRTKLQTPGMLG